MLGSDDYYQIIKTGGSITSHDLNEYQKTNSFSVNISDIKDSGDFYSLTVDRIGEQLVASDDNIPVGSYVNLNLNNKESQQFKVLSIKPTENNKYAILGGEYNSGKFDIIESEEKTLSGVGFFDEIDAPFNIGIPENNIVNISDPVGLELSSTLNNDSSYDLNFAISGAQEGNEEFYNVSVVFPNGMYKNQIVEKGTETASIGGTTFIRTSGSFRGCYTFGDYNVFVASNSGDKIGGTIDKSNSFS
jgi:hypothetical protein